MTEEEQTTINMVAGLVGDLENRCAKVTLEEDEDVGLEIIELEAENGTGMGVDLRWAAIGRFLADKSIRVEAMQQVLAAVWRPVKGLRVKVISNNLFIFQFFHEKDISRILSEGPWAFENATLVLKRLNEGDQPMNVVLNQVEFWIQVHDVPCGFMTEAIAVQIGNMLGTFVLNDPENFGGNWKSYLRIRVGIDVNRPLRRRLKLKKKGGMWAWVSFKYERLYTFCYFCGCLGHSEKFCVKALESDKAPGEYEYGPWLRAPMRRFTSGVGDRWLVKDEPINSAHREVGSPSGNGSGAVTPRLYPSGEVGGEGSDHLGMDVDDEVLTVSDAKRRRGQYNQDDPRKFQVDEQGRLPHGDVPASPTGQARPLA